jgi:SMI1 / KNR4 family (SUKH-1)
VADLYTERRPQLPTSYVSFIEGHGGWESDLGDDLGYVVLWDRATIQERYDGYEMAQYLSSRWFPFGSNGGGEMLCFDLPSGTDQVYWVPYIGMSDEEAMPRYDFFAEVAAAVLKTAEPG